MDELVAARVAFERFTATYGLDAPPVAIEELAGSLCRLRVRSADDLARVAGAPTDTPLSGLLLPAVWEIWVRADEPDVRRRFTIAHEVGHHLLHSTGGAGVSCRPADVDQAEAGDRLRERQANRFAAELLMPEQLVRDAADHHGADPYRLAERFAVSDVAMGFRLVNLGYLARLPAPIEDEYRRWRTTPND